MMLKTINIKSWCIMIVMAAITLVAGMNKANAQSADFKFNEETHNFGKVKIGSPVSYTFKFTNVGDEPIIISKVESSCGCTVPKYSSAPVKKGGAGEITVTYTPAGVPMPFNKTISIFSNAKTPLKVLYIKGENIN